MKRRDLNPDQPADGKAFRRDNQAEMGNDDADLGQRISNYVSVQRAAYKAFYEETLTTT